MIEVYFGIFNVYFIFVDEVIRKYLFWKRWKEGFFYLLLLEINLEKLFNKELRKDFYII